MMKRRIRRDPDERERGHVALRRRVQPDGRGVRSERGAPLRGDRPGGPAPRGPEGGRTRPRYRHRHRTARLPRGALRPAARRRRHRPRGRRDLRRLLSRRERGHPEHPVRDARFAQHRLPRQALRRRGEQPRHPRLRMGPRVPGGPPGAQARRSVHLQRVANRPSDDVRGAPSTPGEVRDRDALERARPLEGGEAAGPRRSGGVDARESGQRPQRACDRRVRPDGSDDEIVPDPLPRSGRVVDLHGIVRLARAGAARDVGGTARGIPDGARGETRPSEGGGRDRGHVVAQLLLGLPGVGRLGNTKYARGPSKPPHVRGTDAHKIYNSGAVTVHALRGVNLPIPKGEMVAIMGPSGCGKTTHLTCFSGLDDLTSGDVRIEGVSLHGMDDDAKSRYRSRRMGFVFQSYNLLPVLTAAENVELPLLVAKAPAKEARRKALALLGQVELDGWEGHKPAQLSAGQQQRVAIARALVNDPAIVWADEPTGNLDSETSAQIMDLLVHLNREQRQTLVLVTHDAIVSSRAHRILRMRNGQIVEETRSA